MDNKLTFSAAALPFRHLLDWCYGIAAKVFKPVACRLRHFFLDEVHQTLHRLMEKMDKNQTYPVPNSMAIPGAIGEVLLKSLDGFIICSASDYAVLSCLLLDGVLEPGTRQVIQQFLSPDDTFVDIGAHLGLHTLAASSAMHHTGKIIAFEPCEQTKRLLDKTLIINQAGKIVEVHQCAVSNTSGQQNLYLGQISGHHSLYPLESLASDSSPTALVLVTTLDEIIASNEKIDLIKIDAEGAELAILEGAESVLKNNPDIALIIEFGPSHLKRTGYTPAQWFSAYSDRGFIFKSINEKTGKLESKSIEELEQLESINVFFARADSKAWLKIDAKK